VPPKSHKVVDVVHKNAPRGACQITVKCSVKCCVGESSNGTETSFAPREVVHVELP